MEEVKGGTADDKAVRYMDLSPSDPRRAVVSLTRVIAAATGRNFTFNPAITAETTTTAPDQQKNTSDRGVMSAERETKSNDKSNDFNQYSYQALVSKPDMKVTIIDDTIKLQSNKQTRKNVVDNALKNAAKIDYKNENGNVFVRVKDIDTDVMLCKSGLRHGLDRRFNLLAPVTVNCGKIIQNAVQVNELIPEGENIAESYVLVGAAKNKKNEAYIVSFVVNRATNEVTSVDVLYSVNTKTEAAGSLSPGVPGKPDYLTASTISISDLLDYVNRYFPDILSEDVLRHYGHTYRPEGKIGESAMYADRDTYISARDLLLQAAEEAKKTKTGSRFLAEYESRVKSLDRKYERLENAESEYVKVLPL